MWYAIDAEFTSHRQFIVQAESLAKGEEQVEDLASKADDHTFIQGPVDVSLAAHGETETELYEALNSS